MYHLLFDRRIQWFPFRDERLYEISSRVEANFQSGETAQRIALSRHMPYGHMPYGHMPDASCTVHGKWTLTNQTPRNWAFWPAMTIPGTTHSALVYQSRYGKLFYKQPFTEDNKCVARCPLPSPRMYIPPAKLEEFHYDWWSNGERLRSQPSASTTSVISVKCKFLN